MIKAFESVVTNADRVTSYTILLILVAALGYILFMIGTGRIPSPGDYKRLDKSCTDLKTENIKLDEMLQKITAELADSRIKMAAATVRIEFLERDIVQRDKEVAGVSARCARLEAELEVLRRER